MKTLLAVAVLALAGCAGQPISGSATNTATGATVASTGVPITNPTIVADLQSAAFNLDSAVAVGALPADDPAPKCIHGVLQQAGIEVPVGTTPAKSFMPKNDGVASLGAIAYIRIQQAKTSAGRGIVVPVDCKALIGTFVIDGMTAAVKLNPISPLLNFLPSFR